MTFWNIFSYLFSRKYNLTFHANCLLRKRFASSVRSYFLEKNKKNIISLSSVEFAHNMENVIICLQNHCQLDKVQNVHKIHRCDAWWFQGTIAGASRGMYSRADLQSAVWHCCPMKISIAPRLWFSLCYVSLCFQRANIIQLTLVISNSLISNNRLSRSENLVPA